jgi:hypothetical protein
MVYRAILCTIVLSITLATGASALTPHHGWSQSFGSTQTERVVGVEGDAYGNIYLLAISSEDVDLGGGVIPNTGSWDILLAKYAPDGTHIWSHGFGTVGSDYAEGLAVDDYGFLSITARVPLAIDFGGGVLPNAGGYDMAVAHFDPDGNHIWSEMIGSPTSENSTDVALDAFGNTSIIGHFENSIDVGTITHSSNGFTDILVIKFDPTGAILWSQSYGGIDYDYANEIVADSGQNIIFSVYSYSSIDFGGGAHTKYTSMDVYLVKLNFAGAYQWSSIYGGNSSDYATGLTIDSQDNIIFTGYFAGTANFGGAPLLAGGSYDVVLAKYQSDGTHLWSQALGGPGVSDNSEAVTTDSQDNIYLTGEMSGTGSFGGDDLTSAGSSDIFVARYTPDGVHEWSYNYGGFDTENAGGVYADPFGNIVFGAGFRTRIDIGGGLLIGAGNEDIVLAKLHHGPFIQSVLDVPGDQGGVVNVAWDACTPDNTIEQSITEYTVWRAVDAAAMTSSLPLETNVIADLSEVKSAPRDLPLLRADGDFYWSLVETVNALGFEHYSALSPTLFDSTAVTADHHYFQVVAHTTDPYVYYASAPDSGYSVDNLAPAAPQNLAAMQISGPGGVELTWNANTEPDLSHYVVYRGDNPGFVADETSLLGESADTAAVDGEWTWDSDYWYKVFAVDTHGNMSQFAMIGPDLTTGINGPSIATTRLEQNVPNPFNPTTTIAFTLAEPGNVTLRVYDAAGRLVSTLVNEHRDAKSHTVTWNGMSASGVPAASGVYFYRLSAPGFEETRRMVLLK